MTTRELFPASLKNLNDRPLIAYAFLAQATNTPGDLLSGLIPIFKPIAKELEGKRFDSNEFSIKVRSLYGIEIHPWAVDDLATRLEAAGLLIKQKLSVSATEFIYAEIKEDFNEVNETDIRLVIQKFIEFAKPILARY